MPIDAVAVYTGAATGNDPRFCALARELGNYLGSERKRLVYGGGRVGLMGEVADATIAAGGSVTGVMPQKLVDGEIAHPALSTAPHVLEIVGSMADRKVRMAQLAEAFICLPGGTGTLDEFFDVWAGQQLGFHAKPIGFLDREYWSPLLSMLHSMEAAGFVRAEDIQRLVVCDSPAELFAGFDSWQPPTPKWSA